MTTVLMQVNNLGKSFKGRAVLEDISFDLSQGDCLALIGPNGAGKTTLLSCLNKELQPSQGHIQFPNGPIDKSQMAVLFQENTIPEGLKVSELLAFFQAIYDNPLTHLEIAELLGFPEERYRIMTEKLSGGQRRLLAFVICLIGRPKILFLDEPTAGMDTSTRKRFWEIIADLKEQGVTIVYSSHYIEEVEHTADRILVLHQGKLLRDTTPFAMRSEEQEKLVTLPIRYAQSVKALSGLYDIQEKGDSLIFRTKEISRVWSELQAIGCPIDDLEISNKTLLDSLFESTREDKS